MANFGQTATFPELSECVVQVIWQCCLTDDSQEEGAKKASVWEGPRNLRGCWDEHSRFCHQIYSVLGIAQAFDQISFKKIALLLLLLLVHWRGEISQHLFAVVPLTHSGVWIVRISRCWSPCPACLCVPTQCPPAYSSFLLFFVSLFSALSSFPSVSFRCLYLCV